jgi:hypothetical protein
MLDRPSGASAWSGYNSAPPPRDAEDGVLESELKRALDRAGRREHDTRATGTPPGWEPIFMAREISGNARAMGDNAREMSVRASLPAISPKRASSGGRNILAISLSAAVVGLAFQQISTQWNQSRTGGNGVRAVPEATTSSAASLYADLIADNTQSGYGVQPGGDDPQSLQLLPSLTDGAPPPRGSEVKGRDSFLREIEQAANVLAASPQRAPTNRAPVTPVSAPIKDTRVQDLEPGGISGAEEQSMLRRARELMERGHVSGARLIFEHLALKQSALGAFALAQTYDAKFLKTILVKGLEPDQKLAARWYRRAAELGTQFADRN